MNNYIAAGLCLMSFGIGVSIAYKQGTIERSKELELMKQTTIEQVTKTLTQKHEQEITKLKESYEEQLKKNVKIVTHTVIKKDGTKIIDKTIEDKSEHNTTVLNDKEVNKNTDSVSKSDMEVKTTEKIVEKVIEKEKISYPSYTFSVMGGFDNFALIPTYGAVIQKNIGLLSAGVYGTYKPMDRFGAGIMLGISL